MTIFRQRMRAVLTEYGAQVGAFSTNARLYLLNLVIMGMSMGVYRVLFNFYVLSLGYDEALIGTLVTTSSMVGLFCALPIGFLSDRFGRKPVLILSSILQAFSFLMMIFFPSSGMFIGMYVVLGLSQSLAGVTMGPFLMENSGEKERTYLFSFSSGLQMASVFVGNWIGGYLPTWVSQIRHISATSTPAYASSLLIISITAGLAVLPFFWLKTNSNKTKRSSFDPTAVFRKQPRLITRLILPMLVTSIGAGLFMPFINVFYRQVYHQPDPVIGTLFAWGSLAMGVGLLIAPPIAERYGKIKLVVITQFVSLPFLAMLGFSPWFGISAVGYYIRLALMNMSGPVYQTFVMEKVSFESRATVASLISMAGNFGWAFSPSISGWLQVNYGFSPVFGLVLVLYALSVYLYWRYFWYKTPETASPRLTENESAAQPVPTQTSAD